jgi:hypothetical protein
MPGVVSRLGSTIRSLEFNELKLVNCMFHVRSLASWRKQPKFPSASEQMLARIRNLSKINLKEPRHGYCCIHRLRGSPRQNRHSAGVCPPVSPFALLLSICFSTAYPQLQGRTDLLTGALPFNTDPMVEVLKIPWSALGTWVAVHVFDFSGPVTVSHPTNSGHATLDYI